MNYFINQRVKEFLESREIKPVDFARVIGLNSDRVSKWFRMKEKIPADHVIIIIDKYKDIDARWLLTGQSQSVSSSEEIPEMLEEEQAEYKKDCCKLCKEKDERIAELKDHIASLKNQLNAKKETSASNSVQHGQFANESKAS